MIALWKLPALLAAAMLLVPSEAIPQSATPVPVDTIARAKFPAEPAEFVDAISALNKLVNEGIAYEDDYKHYGVRDYWVMAPPDGKGDCEDFVLTKIFMLSQIGFPYVSNTKVVTVTIEAGGKVIGAHAILAVLMPNGGVAYLDSMTTEPMTRAELEARGYHFFDWKA